MANVISEYISRFINPFRGLSVSEMVKEAHNNGALFVAKDGALGLKPFEADTWEVLFFVAESKETRKKLIREASDKLHPVSIIFERWKHNNRSRTYSSKLWDRLAA